MRAACLIVWLSLFVAGCSSLPRSEAPNAPVVMAAPSGFPSNVRAVAADRRFLGSLSAAYSGSQSVFGKDALRRMRAAATDGSVDILALSGGGAGGAFGAGALVGMSRRGHRPQFEMVTGVSTGALIAPFAFLGPAWDKPLLDAFSGDRLQNILQLRGPSMIVSPSLYSAEPLIELVDHLVTDELVRAVASESAKGRLLLVATTDLDREETVIWNLGQIAARGGEAARLLFRDVLVASSSIPGIFPPVMIRVDDGGKNYEEMHIDGGAITPFFSLADIVELWSGERRALRGTNLYVLMNSQLAASPSTTAVRPVEILERSFSTTLKHLARTELNFTADFAQRHGMSFRFSEIPIDYPFAGFLDFRRASLEALFKYAENCAADGSLWTTLDQALWRTQHLGTTAACPLGKAESGPMIP
jgi:hypothetical protein